MQSATAFNNHSIFMENDMGVIISRYRDLSSRISEMIYADFKKSVERLDRQRDENVFQLSQARYIQELEKQLHNEVEKMVEKHKSNANLNLLRHELGSQASYILAEFLQKAKAM
jgi:hypothetical protein